jgi:hypothetical protein
MHERALLGGRRISAGIELYGGLDCTKGWTWSQDARTALNDPADAVALTIGKNAGGAKRWRSCAPGVPIGTR